MLIENSSGLMNNKRNQIPQLTGPLEQTHHYITPGDS